MSETTTTTAVAPAAPKAPRAKAAKPSSNGKATARQRVFALLAKKGPLSGPAIQAALKLSGIPSFLKDEAVSKAPRIRRERDKEGGRAILYSLTAAGKKDLAAGKVDENAAERAVGKGLLAEARR